MRVMLREKKTIVKLKHFRFCHSHFILLCGLQHETPNLPLEIDGNGFSRQFVPVHSIDLDIFQQLSLYNIVGD